MSASARWLVYRLPLNEVVFDFYDRLKSISRAMPVSTIRIGYSEGELVKVAFWSTRTGRCARAIVIRSQAEDRGRRFVNA